MRPGNFRSTKVGEEQCCKTCYHMGYDDNTEVKCNYRALKCYFHNDIEIARAISEKAPTSFVCDEWKES